MNYEVKCCAFGTPATLSPNYPEGASSEVIREIDEATAAWYGDYMRGEVHYLSPEAIDRGFRFHSTLGDDERGPYRFIQVLGTDLLCRHGKYFVNPKDENDHRMTDDALPVVMPVNYKTELMAEENADKVVAPKSIKIEGIENDS